MPRCRRSPRIYDDGLSRGDHHDDVKSFYKEQYTEVLDLSVTCIEDHFNQPGYKIIRSLETLLMQACTQDDPAADLHVVCDFYTDDFD